jgi:hypothetical protein
MKIKKLFFLIFLFSMLAFSVFAGVVEITNPLNATSFEALIDSVVDFIFYIGLALVPLMIIISAFYFFTAGGDANQINTAKKLLFYTLIGLGIVLLAKALAALITSLLKE